MTGYLAGIRALVGHVPLVLPGAAVIITDTEDRILLLRRADSGEWGIPGGFIEPGESAEEAARRETREETGLELGELRLSGVYSGERFFHQYPNGDQVYNVTVLYAATGFAGELRADGAETSEARFFPKTAPPNPIAEPVRPILAEVCA
ncbi:MAG: NUDIX hydrolase [Bacillota bacterium]|nr:NUDIX hydrolase [Bacillota bacterium]